MSNYDVFLSHANADKDSFVEGLKQSFDKLGISVFYDKDSIEWGDDWKQRIYDGLANCRYGVIVVSDNFLGREWTENELKELLSRQNKIKRRVYEAQNHKCPYCDQRIGGHTYAQGVTEYDYKEMEGDHIVPWSQGGKTEENNCQMLCKWHNGHKSDN